jgi:hypothetical protein
MLLRVAWLGFIAASLTACCGAREITPEYGQERATLNGRDVVVSYFKNVRRVQQSSPDICWAAALELALAHQGVDTDQNRIVKRVYPKADAVADRRLNMFWWRQELSVTSERLLDGSEVYARNDLDGGVEGLILSSSTFTRKITFELVRNRIPLVGITTGRGGGHIVAVVGAAFPSEVKRLTPSEIVGFLIYDPLTAQPQLLSTEKLFELSTATLVYVSTYDNAWRAIGGEYCSPKKR